MRRSARGTTRWVWSLLLSGVCRLRMPSRLWRFSLEVICSQDQDLVSSVLTLSSVRQGTGHLRKRIAELDGQMGTVGRALGETVSLAIPLRL